MLFCFTLSVVFGWLIWGKFLGWCFNQIPPVQYAGLIKVALTIIVGYFGGVGIHLIFIVLGFMAFGIFS
jgi:hypothetical protein